MATVVLPKVTFTQHCFHCPKCGFPHWFTENQLKMKGIVYPCDCGTIMRPRLTLPTQEEKEPTLDRKFEIAVGMAETVLGMSKKEARENVKAVYSNSKTLEQLIKDALSNGGRIKT
jgi:hypothetical protein